MIYMFFQLLFCKKIAHDSTTTAATKKLAQIWNFWILVKFWCRFVKIKAMKFYLIKKSKISSHNLFTRRNNLIGPILSVILLSGAMLSVEVPLKTPNYKQGCLHGV